MKKILIDISEHNGVVDLSLAKSTISGVVARCSWGWGSKQIDEQWNNNAYQANKLNIPLYAYHFCYARTVDEARKEAKLALKACEKYKVNVIYYDMEYSSFQGDLTSDELYLIAKTFCDSIENAGYSVGIYANEDWFRNKLIHSGFSAWTLWIANYGANDGYDNWNGELQYNPFGNVLLHQFTSKAKAGLLKEIKGIPSNNLDANVDYGLLSVFNNQKENYKNLKYSVGDVVSFDRLYLSSMGSEYVTDLLYFKGEITYVDEGALNPYLINGEDGWCNDKSIIFLE